jgi:hypothetical protein
MPQATNTALRFTRIRLESWRNFRQAEVELAERVFLVGPNASGKSNFLDAFRFLHDVASLGFQSAVKSRGGVSRLRSFSAPESSEISVTVAIGSEAQADLWTYEIRFRDGADGAPILTAEHVRKGTAEILARPDEDDRQDPPRLAQTALEQVSANREFREIADFLFSVFYLHVIPQLVREPERSAGKRADPYGGDFLEQVADVPPRILQERLDWLTQALQAAIPQIERLEIKRDGRGLAHLRARYRPSGRWQTETDLSDGTLRLIGLLWAHLVQPSGPLILEEPEISLHPEIVRRLAQVFALMQSQGGRQVLLSTHSPDLLRDEGIGLDEVLLLLPGDQGTEIRSAASFPDIVALLEGDIPLGEVVLPRTSPEGVHAFALRTRH